MAEVKPFRGIIYEKTHFNNTVMAPPYDVIDEDYKEILKQRNPYNIVNLTLPESYTKAKQLLDEWLKDGILKMDNSCRFYAYSCNYRFDNKERQLKGILIALKVEPFGKNIKPHEKTLKGPKIDRFNLITATHASFCPIMGLYSHDKTSDEIISETVSSSVMFEAEFEDATHSLYAIDSNHIKTIEESFKDKTIIIADGHHRYETALMIKEHFNKQGLKNGGFDYILTLLVDAHSGGLGLFAIHRLIKQLRDKEAFIESLKKYFTVKQGRFDDADFIGYSKDGFISLFLEKRPTALPDGLDAKIFEDIIYKKILKLTDEDIKNQHIAGYAHTEKELIEAVDKGSAVFGFLLKPINYETLSQIVNQGLIVPQKSTYFYPKIPSGLVGYHFDSIKGCENV